MATTPDTLTTWNEALQIDYHPVFGKAIYGFSPTAAIIKKKGKKRSVGGQSMQAVWATQLSQGMGASNLAESGDHAEPVPSRAKNWTLGLEHSSFSFEVSGRLLSATRKKGPQWEKNLMKRKNRELLDNIQFHCAVGLFGDATRLIGQISAVATNQLTISGNGVRHLRKGQRVQVYDLTTGGTIQLTGSPYSTKGSEVLDIDRENNYAHLESGAGAVANDFLYPAGFYGGVQANGLQNIVSQTGTFQGIDRTSVGGSIAKAWLLDLAAGTITERDWMQLNNRISRYAPNAKVMAMFVTDHDTCDDMFEILNTRQRFGDSTDTYDIGYRVMQVHTPDGMKAVIPEKMCNDGDMYGLNPGEFAWLWPEGEEGGAWENLDGNIMRMKLGSTAGGVYAEGWQAYRTCRYNVACDDPQAQALMTNYIGP